jgi:hypothetical protein|tara:strand:- start:975 stop:1178 length:204 start_codon:yes stop_codon:yes gene_type:complete
MIKLKKLRIAKKKLNNLPLFYNYAIYNKLKPNDPFYRTQYSTKFESIINFSKPEKPISKIIDFSKEK